MNRNVFILSVFALTSAVWWFAAWMWPSPLNSDISPVRELLALMGLVFLVSGVAIYARFRSRWTLIFALYCCATSIHWAGPLGANESALDSLLLAAYILLGISLFASLFLHLALAYRNSQLSSLQLVVTYLPVLLTLILLAVALMSPAAEDALPLLFVLGSIYGFVAGMVWLYRLWISQSTDLEIAARLSLTLALFLAWIPNMLVQYGVVSLGDYGGITNLTSLIMLAVLCWIAARMDEELHHAWR